MMWSIARGHAVMHRIHVELNTDLGLLTIKPLTHRIGKSSGVMFDNRVSVPDDVFVVLPYRHATS